MVQIKQWVGYIGRRIRLRDIYVFFSVAENGSMAKAAAQLGVATPSVSVVISDLERTLGVRLFDRTPKGVTLTTYGLALLTRGRAAFDELRQGIRDIESISDPATGDVRIGCPESLASFLGLVIERVSRRWPRIRFHVQSVRWPTVEFPELHARQIDLVLARLVSPPRENRIAEGLTAEVLFDDPFSIVVGANSKWARRRKISLAELADEHWVSTPADVLAGQFVTEAFSRLGITGPRPSVATSSIHLRNYLAGRGTHIAVLPRSVLQDSAKKYALKVLPIKLTERPSLVAIVTLNGRTLIPAVEVFQKCAREVAASFV